MRRVQVTHMSSNVPKVTGRAPNVHCAANLEGSDTDILWSIPGVTGQRMFMYRKQGCSWSAGGYTSCYLRNQRNPASCHMRTPSERSMLNSAKSVVHQHIQQLRSPTKRCSTWTGEVEAVLLRGGDATFQPVTGTTVVAFLGP